MLLQKVKYKHFPPKKMDLTFILFLKQYFSRMDKFCFRAKNPTDVNFTPFSSTIKGKISL